MAETNDTLAVIQLYPNTAWWENVTLVFMRDFVAFETRDLYHVWMLRMLSLE